MMRQGSVDDCQRTPFILGTECSGYIEAMGTGVEDFKVKWEEEKLEELSTTSLFIYNSLIFYLGGEEGEHIILCLTNEI